MKKKIVGMVAGLSMVCSVFAGDYQSKYVAHATSSAINFPASKGSLVLKTLHAESDKAAGLAKVYARTGNAKIVSSANDAGTTILVSNVGAQFVANDLIAYQHADGTLDYSTVASTNTTVSIVLNDAISQAGTAKDVVYELSQQGQFDVAAATVSYIGDAVFTTPDNSPLRIVVDSTSAGYVTATVLSDQ